MKFTVYGVDKKEKLRTFDPNCIYDLPILKGLEEAGYTFKLSGELVTADEVDHIVKSNRTINIAREVVRIVTHSRAEVQIDENESNTELIDGDTYDVTFRYCKRVRSYDDVQTKMKYGFTNYADALAFIRTKSSKAKNYWAGGTITSNSTKEILFISTPAQME